MQDWDKLEEIEALGEEEGEEEPAPAPSPSLNTWPLIQAAVCVLILLCLLYLKCTGHPAYGKIEAFYQREAQARLTLPALPEAREEEGGALPSGAGEATPRPSPSPQGERL